MAGHEVEPGVWLEQMQEGSRTAFGLFYERYADLVYRVALQKTGDAIEAEDICQDVFLEVLDKPGAYDPARGSIEAWLVIKTKSRSLDRIRRRKRVQLENLDERSMMNRLRGGSIDDAVFTRLELDSIHQAMKTMPPAQQSALVGAYLEERTHRELAEALQRPMGTVKSWIRSGLQQLRRSLEQQGLAGQSGGGERHE